MIDQGRDDSPCNGICKIVDDSNGTPKCISCKRTYDDIDEWFKLSRDARLYRMKQLKEGK
tara:strand:+ start:158 stop:337 length:180 start_codon:yes stop_codon:yes gene_type:complete